MLDIVEVERSILLVVFEKENLERMKKADPITLESIASGGILGLPKYPKDFNILIAYEEDDAELYRMAKVGDVGAMLRWLERGRVYDKDKDGKHHTMKLNTRAN
jgi:hypothetical protein